MWTHDMFVWEVSDYVELSVIILTSITNFGYSQC